MALLIEMKSKWPRWLRVVATSRPDEDTHAALKPLTGASIDVESQQNKSDVETFVLQELTRLKGTMDDFHGIVNDVESVCKSICDAARGVMMYAREVIRQFEEFGFLDLEAPPGSLSRLYMNRYIKTFPGDDGVSQFAVHSRPMLEVLIAARDSVPIAIVKMAGYPKGATAEEALWKNRRGRHLNFVQRLCVGNLLEKGMLQLSHKSFADWLCVPESREFQVERCKGHVYLADACWRICTRLGSHHMSSKSIGTTSTVVGKSSSHETNAQRRKRLKAEAKRRRSPEAEENIELPIFDEGITKYALNHGISHLVAAGRCKDARSMMLENVTWLMARREDGMGIMEDCRILVTAAAAGDRSVDLVRRALDLSMADIRQDSRRMPGQLVGRLLGLCCKR